jgi:hypothetical protein
MMNNQTWAIRSDEHASGLAETFWALRDYSPELDDGSYPLFRASVERNGEPALLIGAATGGLLLRLLRDGYDIEAVEPSDIMRAHLRRRAMELKLRLTLYGVQMEHMDLDREYSTIIVPYGTMMLLTDRRRVLSALGRIYAHLQPGGALTFNIELPDTLLSGSDGLPLNPQPEPIALQRSGSESLSAERRFLSLDPVNQIYAEQRIYKLYRERQLVRQEYRTVRERWYSRHEMAMMLAWAGFSQIDVVGVGPDFSQPQRAEQISMLVFTARKRSGGQELPHPG